MAKKNTAPEPDETPEEVPPLLPPTNVQAAEHPETADFEAKSLDELDELRAQLDEERVTLNARLTALNEIRAGKEEAVLREQATSTAAAQGVDTAGVESGEATGF